MAETANQEVRGDEAAPAEESVDSPGNKGLFSRFGSRKWVAVILAVSLANFAVGFVCSRLLVGQTSGGSEYEIDLGRFRFAADNAELGRLADAEFDIHIAMLEHVDLPARQRLEAHRRRVQQDIEELLRQAHSGDFDDPTLVELKRQLQEQINETLGLRAIADVIITDLQMTHSAKDAGPVSETADTVPWSEKPAS